MENDQSKMSDHVPGNSGESDKRHVVNEALKETLELQTSMRQAMDTKAIALLTASFASATLYYLLGKEASLTVCTKWPYYIPLGLLVCSSITAIAGFLPVSFKSLTKTAFENALADPDRDHVALEREIVDFRLAALELMASRNRSRGIAVKVASICLILALVSAAAVLSTPLVLR